MVRIPSELLRERALTHLLAWLCDSNTSQLLEVFGVAQLFLHDDASHFNIGTVGMAWEGYAQNISMHFEETSNSGVRHLLRLKKTPINLQI